ncbi:brain-specific angiogenesis inhibitor 2 [Limosa lapponica baueri]|uniref:Brain-specific angiogenesis inhibitor 2 n=1 Tax=Limosa lapponica baueri TaxID=1758121 RepID=A0A2I0T7A9_LIMLA|nr:brain-specific angiogenesis inhibitor 2 [Limosa lapponica baueri]
MPVNFTPSALDGSLVIFGNAVEENQKVKTQWPRSADEPGVYMAQTVEGQWLEWGAWSRCSVTCANGTQQRTRKCSVAAHGWAECRGAHADARECSNPTCPTDSKWGPWNHWSLCSKTCDTGWQRRFRMCEGTGVQGYPCEGTGEEVKTCNEKKCPVISIQREPVSAVSSDINFPMKGRRGMKDWARSSEDKLFIPREVLSLASAETDESSHFVIGAVLYRTLGLILPPPRTPLAVTSKVLMVTVRPPTKPAEPLVLVELSHIINGTSHPQCVTWDYSRTDAGLGNWDTESCQTLETLPAHTKCQCRQLATFAILAQLPRDLVGDRMGTGTSLLGTRAKDRG